MVTMLEQLKPVVLLVGAGQIGLAIARRISAGKIVIVADRDEAAAASTTAILRQAGFNAHPQQIDLASKDSIRQAVAAAQTHGTIDTLINAAGVSPSQADIATILQVDLYGTAVLLEEVGKVISPGGSGITISSQSGHRLPALTPQQDRLLATTPPAELLTLDFLQPEAITDTLHAYQLAKRCNVKRVMAQAVEWGKRGARINSISPGIIITPLALDEINGPRGDFYRNMFAHCPAGRPGTPDEVAELAQLVLAAPFITGADFLIDGGATASYFYGPLNPTKNQQ